MLALCSSPDSSCPEFCFNKANFLILMAALISLLCFVLHSLHFHSLLLRVKSFLIHPQQEQVLLEASNLPIFNIFLNKLN